MPVYAPLVPILGEQAKSPSDPLFPLPWDSGGAVVNFEPSMLGGVGYDFDADEGITVTGAGVSAWVDKVNGNTGVQGTDANRPAYVARGASAQFNGHAYLNWTGAQGLAVPDHATLEGSSTGAEWYVVIHKVGAYAGTPQIISKYGGVAGTPSYQVDNNAGFSRIVVANGGAAQVLSAGVGATADVDMLIRWQFNNTTNLTDEWENNTQRINDDGTITAIDDGTSQLQIGYFGAGFTLPWVGHMARLLMFQRSLSAAEQALVVEYLRARYALW